MIRWTISLIDLHSLTSFKECWFQTTHVHRQHKYVCHQKQDCLATGSKLNNTDMMMSIFRNRCPLRFLVCTAEQHPLMRTPLRPSQSVLIRGVALYQGLFNIRMVLLGQHTMLALQWMSLFQGCPQGEGSTVYRYIAVYNMSPLFTRLHSVHREGVGNRHKGNMI